MKGEKVYRTRSGKLLTDEDIERLADEAERGYDVGHLLVKLPSRTEDLRARVMNGLDGYFMDRFLDESKPPGTRGRQSIEPFLESRDALDLLIDEIELLRRREAEVQGWFKHEPWKGDPDPGSFGGHSYSENERAIGYGSYRDPRFLPSVLRGLGS